MSDTVLLQGLDASNTLDDQNHRFASISAKLDLFVSGLLGVSCVLPAGNVGDSPIFHDALRQVYGAKGAGEGNVPWVPFRLALDHTFQNYTDFVVRYPQMASGKRAVVGDEVLNPAIQAYVDRDFAKLDDYVPGGYGAVAELVHRFVEPEAAQRPLDGQMHRTPDYLAYVRFRAAHLHQEKYTPKFQRIDTITKRLIALEKPPAARGELYKLENEFEEAWPLVRLWIDEHFSHNIQDQYNITSRAATTHTVKPQNFSDLELFIRSFRRSPRGYEFLRHEMQQPDVFPDKDPLLDFSVIWELHRHHEFRASAERTRAILHGDAPESQKSDELERHVELIASNFSQTLHDRNKLTSTLSFLGRNGERLAENAFLVLTACTIMDAVTDIEAVGQLTREVFGGGVLRTAQDIGTLLGPVDDGIEYGGAAVSPTTSGLAFTAGSWAWRKRQQTADQLRATYGNLLRYHLRKNTVARPAA
jgi:hypothetical protein